MPLHTKITLLKTVEEVEAAIADNDKLLVCAGRWGPMCIPVYGAMEELEADPKYKNITFRVIDFDTAAVQPIRQAKECSDFKGLPFTIYYRNGGVAHATSSIQTKEQLEDNIEQYLLSEGD